MFEDRQLWNIGFVFDNPDTEIEFLNCKINNQDYLIKFD